jgi:hypothetical protein
MQVQFWGQFWAHTSNSSTVASFLTSYPATIPILAAVSLQGMGVMPKIGPGRALTFRLSSRFSHRRRSLPLTERKTELQKLLNFAKLKSSLSYAVVTGQSGVGKTFLLENFAATTRAAVISLSVMPETTSTELIHRIHLELSNILPVSYLSAESNARRVLYYYRLLFRSSPVILLKLHAGSEGESQGTRNNTPSSYDSVLDTPMHSTNQCLNARSQNLIAAVNSLVDDYGLRVIIEDTCDAWQVSGLMNSPRSTVIQLDEMTREQIETMPQLRDLFVKVKRVDDPNGSLADLLWTVLGGVPMNYVMLSERVSKLTESDNIQKEIHDFILGHITQAIKLVHRCYRENCELRRIVSLLEPDMSLAVAQIPREITPPENSRMFRHVFRDGEWRIVPTNNAVAVVMRNNLKNVPTITWMMSQCKTKKRIVINTKEERKSEPDLKE